MLDISPLRKKLEDSPNAFNPDAALIADALYYIGDTLALIGMASQANNEAPEEPSQYIDGSPIEK